MFYKAASSGCLLNYMKIIMATRFSKPWHGEAVNAIKILVSVFISVVAGVVGYYICQWLNRNGKCK